MLNADLFQDKKDREIARLKLTIEHFKKYDEERKEYYAEKMNRLEQLESYISELENDKDSPVSVIKKLEEKIASQKDEIRTLSMNIQAHNIGINIDTDVLSLNISKKSLSQANEKLRKENRNLKNTVYQLTTELNQLKNKN